MKTGGSFKKKVRACWGEEISGKLAAPFLDRLRVEERAVTGGTELSTPAKQEFLFTPCVLEKREKKVTERRRLLTGCRVRSANPGSWPGCGAVCGAINLETPAFTSRRTAEELGQSRQVPGGMSAPACEGTFEWYAHPPSIVAYLC